LENFWENSLMKRLLFLLGAVLVSSLAGCQEPSRYSMTPGSLEVVVEDGGKFPEFLVGKWVGDKYGWGFIFEPDGNIFRARIAMGQVEITPGKVNTIPTITDGKGIFIPGDWLVSYSPAFRELYIDLVMNYIHIDFGDGALKGKTRYVVIGAVSEDGDSWPTTVSSFMEYEGFPIDPNDMPYTEVVNFTKIVEE
jgi:hypothetical protein